MSLPSLEMRILLIMLLFCPSILKPAHANELALLVGNLTKKSLVIDPRQSIAFVCSLSANESVDIATCGLLQDLGHPNPAFHVTLPPLDADIAPSNHAKVLPLPEEYADLFSEGPQDFGLMKGTSHRLKLKDNRPFLSQPYQKTKIEEAQVAIELRQLLNVGLLQNSKSPWG